MNRVRPPPMEKNQKETGITLSFLRSDAIHCTRNRIEKKAWPRKPTASHKCSDVIMLVSSIVRSRGRSLRIQPLTLSDRPPGRKEFRREGGYTGSVGPEVI